MKFQHSTTFKCISGLGQAGMSLNEDEMYRILNSLHQNKNTITKKLIQLLHDKWLFYSLSNIDPAFEK